MLRFMMKKKLKDKEQPLSLKMYIGSAKTYVFVRHVCAHACFHLISNMQIVRTFKNRIPIQTFEKWHNVSYHYFSYVKLETSDIWRTNAWFLEPFRERVEEKHIYDLVKPNSIVKIRTVYRGCNVCYQVFFENWKIDFKSKHKFNINFQT